MIALVPDNLMEPYVPYLPPPGPLTVDVAEPTGGYLQRCPSCGMPPATRCRDLTTGALLDGIHGSRIPTRPQQEAPDVAQ